MENTADRWFYEEGGQSKGPVEESEIKELIDNRTILPESRIWKKGMLDWTRVNDTEFRNYIKLTEGLIPPSVPDSTVEQKETENEVIQIKDRKLTLWLLAFAPLIGIIVEGAVDGAFKFQAGKQPSPDYNGQFWYLSFLINIGIAYWDVYQVKGAGLDTRKLRNIAWLVPVYLWRRTTATNESKGAFVVWVILQLLMLN